MKKIALLFSVIFMFVLISAVCAVGVSAEIASGKCGDRAYWSYDSQTMTLTISGSGRVEFVNGFSGEPWLRYSAQMKSVVIEEGITELGPHLFWGYNIESIKLPDTIRSIDVQCFAFCQYLGEIELPKNIEYIHPSTFDGTGENFIINGKGREYCTVDGVLYSSDKTHLMAYPAQNPRTSFVVPDFVRVIGEMAFCYSNNLEEVTIGSCVATIMDLAFYSVGSIRSIKLPASVEYVGIAAFENCLSLEIFYVDNKNKYFSVDEAGVLYSKDGSVLIAYPCGRIDNSYTIKDGCLTIESRSMSGNKYIRTVVIPQTVEEVRWHSFSDCSNLKYVYFEGNCPYIDPAAFNVYNDNGVSTIEIYYPISAKGWNSLYFDNSDTSYKEIQLISYDQSAHTCDHELDTSVSSTCEEAGYNLYVCPVCNDSYKEELPLSTDHTWIYVDTTPATCTEKGSKNYICSVCNASKVDDISPTGHNYGEWQMEYDSLMNGESVEISRCVNEGCDAYQSREVEVVIVESDAPETEAPVVETEVSGLQEPAETQEPAEIIDDNSKDEVIDELSNKTCNHEWHYTGGMSNKEDDIEYQYYTCAICLEQKVETIVGVNPGNSNHKYYVESKSEFEKLIDDNLPLVIIVCLALVILIVIIIVLSIKNKKLAENNAKIAVQAPKQQTLIKQVPTAKKVECPVCGQYVEASEQFCPVCGTKLNMEG